MLRLRQIHMHCPANRTIVVNGKAVKRILRGTFLLRITVYLLRISPLGRKRWFRLPHRHGRPIYSTVPLAGATRQMIWQLCGQFLAPAAWDGCPRASLSSAFSRPGGLRGINGPLSCLSHFKRNRCRRTGHGPAEFRTKSGNPGRSGRQESLPAAADAEPRLIVVF